MDVESLQANPGDNSETLTQMDPILLTVKHTPQADILTPRRVYIVTQAKSGGYSYTTRMAT